MKQIFVRHFLISFGLILITAILWSFLQYQSAYDYFWFIAFAVVSGSGLVFSILFSIFQSKLQKPIGDTAIWVGMLSIYFIVLFYVDIHLKIDWNAVSEGRVQLTLFEKIVKSDLSFWLAFLAPFMLSFSSYILKSNSKPH